MNKIMRLMSLRHEFYINNPDLGGTHLHLLEHLAICANAGYPLTVTEAMQLRTVASPATIYRHLDDLIDHSYVYTDHHNDDKRSKYIHLTLKGKRYFNKLEQLIARTV